jgi:hypothetical protein
MRGVNLVDALKAMHLKLRDFQSDKLLQITAVNAQKEIVETTDSFFLATNEIDGMTENQCC